MKKMVMAIMAGAMMMATATSALAATPQDSARLEQSYSSYEVSREDACCGGGYGRGGRGGYGGCYGGYYDGSEER